MRRALLLSAILFGATDWDPLERRRRIPPTRLATLPIRQVSRLSLRLRRAMIIDAWMQRFGENQLTHPMFT
jgi:hypothetical protein